MSGLPKIIFSVLFSFVCQTDTPGLAGPATNLILFVWIVFFQVFWMLRLLCSTSSQCFKRVLDFPYVSVTQSANIAWLKHYLAKKLIYHSQTMTDWRTHHKGQGVFCFCVIFRVCIISKMTKESHSKMEIFQKFTIQSSSSRSHLLHRHTASWRWSRAWQNSGLIVFFTKRQEGTVTTVYFLKITTKYFILDGFYCKIEF